MLQSINSFSSLGLPAAKSSSIHNKFLYINWLTYQKTYHQRMISIILEFIENEWKIHDDPLINHEVKSLLNLLIRSWQIVSDPLHNLIQNFLVSSFFHFFVELSQSSYLNTKIHITSKIKSFDLGVDGWI